MKFLDLNGVSILWRRIKETFTRKDETVSDISRNDTTFTVTRADGTTFEFTQKDTTYDVATTAISGLMSAIDKAKLNSIESSAQENIIESVSVNGTAQPISNKGIDITVPTAVSDLADDVGYLTKESDPTVPAWAKASTKPTYTAAEVGALSDDTVIPSKVSELTNDSGYLTQHQDISGKANTADLSAVATSGSYADLTGTPTIPVVPTNVSAFINDAGYLTQHQDISGKVNTADLATVATSGSYTDLANKPSIPTVPTKVSAFANDADYANEQYVDNAITTALADIVGIEYHVCTAQEYNAQTFIPTLAGETGVIYLVPKPASLIGSAEVEEASVSGNNIYYEFIYNGRSFEMIGDTQVSLDGYLEDSDVSTDAEVQSIITEIFGGA